MHTGLQDLLTVELTISGWWRSPDLPWKRSV